MKVFILDNYDSFTYNLSHYVESFDIEVCVKLNDQFELSEIEAFDKIILSPGPGLPEEAGRMLEVIKEYHTRKPILGVCLGMQALAEFFNETLCNLNIVKHGIQEQIFFEQTSLLFQKIQSPFYAGLYHSWSVNSFENNPHLIVTSKSENNVVMSIEHRKLPLYGVQFHPESVLTPEGKLIIENFLNL
ncbi:MAG: aminodeoxychorismate/anthranilate synthase component II [Flavobacteriia bacterium]|nr:aminodeoxychorismate/anthranilate synthase component II [Flavobacteriia bacterium]